LGAIGEQRVGCHRRASKELGQKVKARSKKKSGQKAKARSQGKKLRQGVGAKS